MLRVIQISSDIADIVHNIQKKSFELLLDKYQDYEVNPAMESVEVIKAKIDRANTIAYIFQLNDINVGWVRVMEFGEMTYKISALSVLPEYQNRGIAKEALKQIESYYPNASKWILIQYFRKRATVTYMKNWVM
ncbi:GNAT family N-acetyltransferase [Clostridium gasigenes]|uniref:GNAT family N-acetyltransferase n=1 Tax=Clostridium gasigenes TaxID=94869 RepID=UPI001C0D5F6C|nr:GNAT family N-acetyltransferase [Clostridium gasigenes]MBU3106505.1 GNAT family N-acetyltransferase [Clostridium gasigenes]